MKPYLPAALSSLAVLLTSPVLGEEAQPKPAAIGVSVAEVIDIRAVGNQPSECRLALSLTGDAVADAYSLHRIHVTKAVDELGRDLTKPDNQPVQLASVYNYASAEDEQRRLAAVAAEVARRREIREGMVASSAPLPITMPGRALPPPTPRPVISLRNPSRQSATIKLIEGEIELFRPTADNGGTVLFPGILGRPAEPVQDAALAGADVRLMYVTPESYEAKRPEAGADAKDPASPWSDEFANSLKSQVRQASLTRRAGAYFFLHDPRHEVVDLDLQTPDGKSLGPRVGSGIGDLRAFSLGQPPPANAQLVVHLATPHALTTYPFKLENIALP